MKLLGWFGGGHANSVAEGEIQQLTDQFHVTLRAHFARMPALDGKLAPGPFNASRICCSPIAREAGARRTRSNRCSSTCTTKRP